MPDDLTRQTLARQVARQIDGLTVRLAHAAITLCFEIILQTVAAGGTVTVVGFGTFSRGHRKARRVRHPRTRELIEVPESYTLSFTPSDQVRESLTSPTNLRVQKPQIEG